MRGSFKKILIISALALSLNLWGCNAGGGTPDASAPTRAEAEAETASPAVSATEAVSPVKVQDSEDGEITITPPPGVKASTLSKDKFYKNDDGYLAYGDSAYSSQAGVDVSSYSGDIDWRAVKKSGIDFALIRIGGRGYGESGNLYTDEKALDNIRGAKENNIDVGAYFYSQAVSVKEAGREARYVLDTLNGESLSLPVGYDFEYIDFDSARTDNVTPEQRTKFARAFASVIQEGGYGTMLYGESHDFYKGYLLEELKDIPLWYAQYGEKPDFYYDFKIWQYSKEGRVPGITGSVDLNIMLTQK